MFFIEQAFYSILLHIYLDLNVNFASFTVADTIDLLCFFAFKCNGTSAMAEIHRSIMNDIDRYSEVWTESESTYDFLCTVYEMVCPGFALGSCTEPRFTYCAGSNDTHWPKLRSALFKLIVDARHSYMQKCSKVQVRKQVHSLVDTLLKKKCKGKKVFVGAGPMNVNHFIHGAAFLGLLPLAAYQHAGIKSTTLGPGKLIALCNGATESPSVTECNNILYNLTSEFGSVWNQQPSANFAENSLCYAYRTYSNTIKSLPPLPAGERYGIDVIMDDEKRVESSTKNVYYMDEQRNRVQNMFCIRTAGNGSSSTRPCLVMKDASIWSTGDRANLVLTNWLNDSHDKCLLQWDSSFHNLSLNTVLQVSEVVKDIYSL